jgi:tRNA(Ile)-lysidine synthetase-like protein
VQEPIHAFSPYDLPFFEGEMRVPDSNWTILVQGNEKNLKVHNLSTAPYIFLTEESVIMKDALHWRTRREGDRILMRGMHRSVRRLMREAKLSLPDRERLPILCRGEEILWIPFVGVRDGIEARSTDNRRVLVRLDHELTDITNTEKT